MIFMVADGGSPFLGAFVPDIADALQTSLQQAVNSCERLDSGCVQDRRVIVLIELELGEANARGVVRQHRIIHRANLADLAIPRIFPGKLPHRASRCATSRLPRTCAASNFRTTVPRPGDSSRILSLARYLRASRRSVRETPRAWPRLPS